MPAAATGRIQESFESGRLYNKSVNEHSWHSVENTRFLQVEGMPSPEVVRPIQLGILNAHCCEDLSQSGKGAWCGNPWEQLGSSCHRLE